MSRIGPEEILAVGVAIWFVVAGILGLIVRPPQGRRALPTDSGPLSIARRVRAVVFVLGGLAVAAGAAIQVLELDVPMPGRALGLGLAALSLWPIAEASRPPVRWLALVLYGAGFALAVAYAGFRA